MSSTMVVQMTQEQLKGLLADALRDALSGKLDLSALVASAPSAKGGKAPKAKKEKDPDAPKKEPNSWIKFTSRVRAVLTPLAQEGKKLSPKAVTQTASALKDAGLLDSATDEQIRAAYQSWLANPPAVGKWEAAHPEGSKSKRSVDGSSTGSGASEGGETPKKKRGPKKLSEMTEEERAAHEAKKAAKKAAKAAGGGAAASPKKAAKKAEPESDDEEDEAESPKAEGGAEEVMDFEPFTWKKMSLLKNARGDVLTEDMEWFGKWDEKAQKVDTSAAQPADLDL
jgi:hypothetical protein